MPSFIVVSGLPGSGKTTAGQLVATQLELPLIDKDALLEELFDSKGVGDSAWRRRLSRDADRLLEQRAVASPGAVVVSHWHLPGMADDSGSPTGWIRGLPLPVVHLRCVCPPAIAARRFFERRRHPGHLDVERSLPEVRASIDALERLGHLDLEPVIEVDTTRELNAGDLVRRIATVTDIRR